MKDLGLIILGVAILVFFVWLLVPTSSAHTKPSDSTGDPFIDPDDAQQIGMLVGLAGGTIPDAAVMRYALDRFQKIHGRRATTRDIGIVLGIIQSTRS